MSGDSVQSTAIPGLLLVDIPVHEDGRGWFKENWHRGKMVGAGLPDFRPVQNNVSYNAISGTTRGVHAEPWDKLVSVVAGRVFGAWVDLREGASFGTVVTAELGAGRAAFVPRGVGNSFQTLDENTVYSYLVNQHWSADKLAEYTYLNLADETVSIDWPIPLDRAAMSDKDRAHPRLSDVSPMKPKPVLVIGSQGQLGRALCRPDSPLQSVGAVHGADRDTLDITDASQLSAVRWSDYGTVVNASAITDVDGSEGEGREAAWRTNVTAVAGLAAHCSAAGVRLVHVSSDYVFDGTQTEYDESASLSPLGVYGQTKAAGDAVVSTLDRHFIVRTSWVIGHGKNFVRTMLCLAAGERAIDVVNDQVGRLTFTEELASAITHLIATEAPSGTYNVTGSGEPASWAELASRIFELAGTARDRVRPVSTADYAGPSTAPRPARSVLDLSKIRATGFLPGDQWTSLERYVRALLTAESSV